MERGRTVSNRPQAARSLPKSPALLALSVVLLGPAVGCAPRKDPAFAPTTPPESLRARGDSSASHDHTGLGGTSNARPESSPAKDSGLATWYGAQFAGKKTASGERFDPDALTAAHRTLPFGTWVEVRRTSGSLRTIRVRINDRGPFGDSRRIIDLSRKAAQALDMIKDGVATVELRVVSGPD